MFAGVFVPGTCTVKAVVEAVDDVGAGAGAVAVASMRCCCPNEWWLSLPYQRPCLWRPLLERPLLPRWWWEWSLLLPLRLLSCGCGG